MFGLCIEIKEMLLKVVEKFRQKGAVSPDKAMSIEELGLSPKFKDLMEGPPGLLGVFVEVDGKYYLSEERLRKIKEKLEFPPPPPLRHWIRHTASVPKGFLRYHVLRLLKDKPMSGSEIMREIKKRTNGRWKPSPGSVYPLLAWLQDSGYTKETPKKEKGIKRYMLTEKGEKFFKEQTKLSEKLRRKLKFSASMPFGGFWFGPHYEKLHEIREPGKRFVRALFNLRMALEDNLTEQAINEVKEFLNSTAEKIEEISKRVRGE
jgi:DNA-binding PadR family transcriptional regulator